MCRIEGFKSLVRFSSPMTITIDAHADTLLKVYLSRRKMDMLGLPPRLQVTGDKMREGGLNLEVFAIFIAPYLEDRARETAIEMVEEGKWFLEREGILRIEDRRELEDPERGGGAGAGWKAGGIISLEGALPLGDRAGNLEMFYETGVRLLTLAWNRKNAFACGAGVDDAIDGGLTGEGKHLLELAGQLGVVIDVSHLNRQGMKDVAELTDVPIVASHSCAHAVHPHPRNLRDDEIEAIAATGGVIGVNFYTRFLNGTKEATIRDVTNHIHHIAAVGGVPAVGIGTDFDGIYTFPAGLEDVSKLPDLERELGGSYSKKVIEAIMGGNFRRVFGRVLR